MEKQVEEIRVIMRQRKDLIRKIFFSLILLIMTAKSCISIYERYVEFLQKGSIVVSFLFIVFVTVFMLVFFGILLWKPTLLQSIFLLKSKSILFRRIAAGVICFLPIYLFIFHRWNEPYHAQPIRIFLYVSAIILSAWVLSHENRVTMGALVSASLCFSVLFALCSQFRDVNNYPFSVGWSEGNRMWDYSVLFGKKLYDWPQDQTIPAYIDVGRQSLWGVIFLLPRVSIAMMRGWNDFLFTLPYALLGWILLRKTEGLNQKYHFAAGLWAMLFLIQGPIYTPLILAAVLVAIGRRFSAVPAILLTFLAGYYAVMSRSTWVAAPAAFAVMLAFIEQRRSYDLHPGKRWLRSVLVGFAGLSGAVCFLKKDSVMNFLHKIAEFGTIIAQGSQDSIEAVSQTAAGNAPAMLSPEWFQYFLTRQPLLWNRLWPNETYQPGILLGLLMAILPLTIILIVWTIQKKWNLDTWQRLLLIIGQSAFLGVGILISVKIGGGSNLHNLYMFLLGLLIIAALAWEAGMGCWLAENIRAEKWISLFVIAAILLPVYQDAMHIEPKKYPAAETTLDAVEKIQQSVAAHADGEILFMDQRQMLTFGLVPKVSLIADYEKKWMMDEAMADNGQFFQPYIEDLKSHRFDLIISEPLWIKFQGEGLDFSEENDLFVKWVSIPTLCYYEPQETFLDQGVQILVPRSQVLQQEGVVCP